MEFSVLEIGSMSTSMRYIPCKLFEVKVGFLYLKVVYNCVCSDFRLPRKWTRLLQLMVGQPILLCCGPENYSLSPHLMMPNQLPFLQEQNSWFHVGLGMMTSASKMTFQHGIYLY